MTYPLDLDTPSHLCGDDCGTCAEARGRAALSPAPLPGWTFDGTFYRRDTTERGHPVTWVIYHSDLIGRWVVYRSDTTRRYENIIVAGAHNRVRFCDDVTVEMRRIGCDDVDAQAAK